VPLGARVLVLEWQVLLRFCTVFLEHAIASDVAEVARVVHRFGSADIVEVDSELSIHTLDEADSCIRLRLMPAESNSLDSD
jgi:hypothetical protein